MTSAAHFQIAATLLVAALLAGCGGSRGDGQAEATRSRVVFVRCVRAHGVRNFPYPTAQGRVSVAMVRASGINPQSPLLARAVSACLPAWLRPPKTP